MRLIINQHKKQQAGNAPCSAGKTIPTLIIQYIKNSLNIFVNPLNLIKGNLALMIKKENNLKDRRGTFKELSTEVSCKCSIFNKAGGTQ